jgi:NADPH:quinone reductase-like Zn-dependent oxidoreductase
VAGVVPAVGPDVSEFNLGDEVLGWCMGAFTELVVAKESNLVRRPSVVSFEEAAALPVAGMLAL